MSAMVLNRTAVAAIRDKAVERQQACSAEGIGNEPIAACWQAIADACRELDPAAVPSTYKRRARRPVQLDLFGGAA